MLPKSSTGHENEIIFGMLTPGVIENYRILTPTEINVVDSEWFKKTLLNLKAKDAEELKKLAELTILSFDPCTQMDVELKNA